MKKSGQFYLLSAIVIISILIGFSTISTYTKKSADTRVFDLGEELDIESANVLDFGTYPDNAGQVGDLDEFLLGFINNYSEYLGDDKELSFVIGNPNTGVTVVNYSEVNNGCITTHGTNSCTNTRGEPESTLLPINPDGEVEMVFNEVKYNFKLNPGQNFFFVISEDVGEEVYTTKSGRGRGR